MAHQPQNLVATATSSTTIDLSWDDVETLTDEFYDVERDGVIIEQDVAGTTYSDTGLDADTEYTYRVRAVGGTAPPTSYERAVTLNATATITVAGTVVPATVAGLVAWYDFSDVSTLWQDTARTSAITTDGQSIAGVTDRSGAANHLAQATAGNRPVYKVNIKNGRSAWRQTNVGDTFMRATAAPITTDCTIIGVWQSLGTASRGLDVWGQRSSSSATPIRAVLQTFGSGGAKMNVYFRNDAGSLTASSDTTSYSNTWVLGTATYSGTTQTVYSGTTQKDQDTNSGGTTTTNIITVGDRDGLLADDGYIGEVVVWNRALTSGELSQVWTYLSTKWAV